MFAIGIELLAGRYVATAYNDRQSAEWPPHPARLFSALVATWGDGSRDERQREALAWLARQAPPLILASPSDEVAHRSVAPVFVPVNDEFVVSPPDRTKLEEARAALAAAGDAKAKAKAEKELAKLELKLLEATAKAVATPSKFGKADATAGRKVLPEGRTRQPRTFPCVTPSDPRIAFVWPDAQPSPHQAGALDELLKYVVRVGHSSSFVLARQLDEGSLTPLRTGLTSYREDEEAGDQVLRWVDANQVDALQSAYELHQETEPRVLPAVFKTYREGGEAIATPVPTTLFDPKLVILARVGGPRLPITSVPGVSQQLRRALMAALGTDVPELLSGHGVGGGPSEEPHLAIAPLPFVGHQHADGAVLGVALVLPRAVAASDRRRVLAAIAKLARPAPPGDPAVVELHLGSAGSLELQLVEWGDDPRTTLQPASWTRPSRRWLSATPIALDRNPGDLHALSHAERSQAFEAAEASLAQAIERVGLPRPHHVEVVRSCVLGGSAKPRSYGRFPRDEKKPQRVLVHARVEFSSPVRGPLLVGAGRYQGMGLFLPIDGRGSDVTETAVEREVRA